MKGEALRMLELVAQKPTKPGWRSRVRCNRTTPGVQVETVPGADRGLGPGPRVLRTGLALIMTGLAVLVPSRRGSPGERVRKPRKQCSAGCTLVRESLRWVSSVTPQWGLGSDLTRRLPSHRGSGLLVWLSEHVGRPTLNNCACPAEQTATRNIICLEKVGGQLAVLQRRERGSWAPAEDETATSGPEQRQ